MGMVSGVKWECQCWLISCFLLNWQLLPFDSSSSTQTALTGCILPLSLKLGCCVS